MLADPPDRGSFEDSPGRLRYRLIVRYLRLSLQRANCIRATALDSIEPSAKSSDFVLQ